MKNDSLSNTYLALSKLNTTCNGIDKISNPSTNQEIIANLTAKTAEEVRSHMIQVMSNFLSTYADHLCTVAVSSISSSINPLYWIDLILFLPKTLLSYLGISSKTSGYKICNVLLTFIWWVFGVFLVYYKPQLQQFLIELVRNI